MFSARCDHCGGDVLLSSRRILLMENTDRGVVVLFRCWAGHLGTWVTGRRGPGPGPAVPARQATVPHDALPAPERHASRLAAVAGSTRSTSG